MWRQDNSRFRTIDIARIGTIADKCRHGMAAAGQICSKTKQAALTSGLS
jgi:hypothetical protein